MQNEHMPGREEVYLAVQISIITPKKLHQNHKLAYNLFSCTGKGAFGEVRKYI